MIRILKLFLILAGWMCVAQNAYAQDPRFSQYYASPFQLNPALTGVFNGRYRVVANYRDQWNSFLAPVPFRTYAASADVRLNVGESDYFALGLGALRDEAGTAKYAQTKAHLGASYLKQLSGGRRQADHYIVAGAQIGMGQNSIDWSKLWFGRQFDTGLEAPNTNLSSGENASNGSSDMYLDFNAGLVWYAIYENEGYMYAGVAGNHLNSPKISILENSSETLYRRWVGNVGGFLPLNDNFGILPGLLAMVQGPAFETNIGANFRYSNNDLNELALRAGLWARVGNKLDKGIQMDALIFSTMLELNRWTVGLSYDVTTSTLRKANNSRGAFELSLIYYHPETRRSKVKCPKM